MIGTGNTSPDVPLSARIAPVAGWIFVACAAIAVGYGAWAILGSGTSLVNFDVRPDGPIARAAAGECPEYGPLSLDPKLNPFRAVLRTGYAPVGSERYDFVAALVDESGRTVWEQRGALGSGDDEASFVRHQTALLDFEVSRPGRYTLQVQFDDGSLDDLREAALEIRGGIARVDARIPWGFGLLAVASLIVHLFTSRRAAYPYAPAEEEEVAYREAA